jgi:hypothetical protein
MIEIASPATPQLSSLCRWSFDRADGARPMMLRQRLCDRRRHAEPGPNAGGTRSPRPINPSKCGLPVVSTSRKATLALLKSPLDPSVKPSFFQPAIRALALLGRLSWERVDRFGMQASEKPAQERTFRLSVIGLCLPIIKRPIRDYPPIVTHYWRIGAALRRKAGLAKASVPACSKLGCKESEALRAFQVLFM